MKWSFTTQFEFGCTAAVLIIGLVTCLALRSRLTGATLPLAGLFLLAADSKLLWPSLWAFSMVEQLGCVKTLRHHPWLGIWYYGWQLLPILLAGLFAWALWRELRRVLPLSGQPAHDHDLRD